MEKKKDKIIIYSFISFLIMIFLVAGYKNLKTHREKEYEVLYSEILEHAKECYQKSECEGNITLNDLYDKNYLEVKYDPVTKERLDRNMCIYFANNEAKFCN